MFKNFIIGPRSTLFPYFFVFLFAFILQFNSNAQSCQTTDSLALVALFESTNGLCWDLNDPFESWEGITTDQNGCVIGILFFWS